MGFRVNGGGGVVWRAEHSQSQMEFRGLTILFIIVIMIIVITLESTYLFEPFPGVVSVVIIRCPSLFNIRGQPSE